MSSTGQAGVRTDVDVDTMKEAMDFMAGGGDVVDSLLENPQAMEMTLGDIIRRGVAKRVESLEQELADIRVAHEDEVSRRRSMDDDIEPFDEGSDRMEELVEAIADGRDFLQQLEG